MNDPNAIELRVRGCMLGVLRTGGTASVLEIKRGSKLYSVNLTHTVAEGMPLIIERLLHPEGEEDALAHSLE